MAAQALLQLPSAGAAVQSPWEGSRARGPGAVVERALPAAGPRISSTGSVAVAHGLSCLMAGGIFPDQG